MKTFLTKLAEGQTLTQTEAENAMHILLQGEATELEIAAFLLGLRSRGETLEELVGFTKIMREYMINVECADLNAIDVCGTGGDRSGTFNISTTVAFVCAGAGVTVAKHGNRSVSSQSGSADVLEKLGVKTDLGKEGVEKCLSETSMAFIFAPLFHPALKHVMPVRRALGVRTFFNILGPLCNPAGVNRQLIGAFSWEVAKTMAQICARLDKNGRYLCAHAEDGLDELSTTALTNYVLADQKGVAKHTISPEDFGMPRVHFNDLQGGNAATNAEILKAILKGDEKGAKRDIVILNAAHALYVSGKFASLDECVDAAHNSLDAGKAAQKLAQLIEVSQSI